jgi:hypothetical protein
MYAYIYQQTNFIRNKAVSWNLMHFVPCALQDTTKYSIVMAKFVAEI